MVVNYTLETKVTCCCKVVVYLIHVRRMDACATDLKEKLMKLFDILYLTPRVSLIYYWSVTIFKATFSSLRRKKTIMK